ncbi:hypothetical protein FRB95_000707 [Tulasnella sp. JGI-2019a]|nr:hypothetical protein FRB95_000707 [Tulasnella sp. JGI-2019a]
MSFWTYQTHQESSFQVALLKNANEKNADMSKQLDNVIHEARSQIELLTNKNSLLERDLELERRKTRELSDASREKDKEYQKLKNHYDSIKRKALLAPSILQHGAGVDSGGGAMEIEPAPLGISRGRGFAAGLRAGVSMGDVVNGMEANRVQRTPLRPAAGGGFNNPQQHVGDSGQWQQTRQSGQQPYNQQRRAFNGVQQPHQPISEVYGFGNPTRGGGSRGGGSAASDNENLIEEIPRPVGMPLYPPAYRSAAPSRSGNGNQTFHAQHSGNSGRSLVSAGMPPVGRRPGAAGNPVMAQPSTRRSSGGFRPAPFAGR